MQLLILFLYFYDKIYNYLGWEGIKVTVLKVEHSPSKPSKTFCINESSSKIMKSAFYFILNRFLKIFKLLTFRSYRKKRLD